MNNDMPSVLRAASTRSPATAAESSPAAAAPSPTRWWTLALVTIGTFMLTLDLTVVNVALGDVRISLNADFSGLQWVLDAYALSLAVFLLTSGSLADRYGGRRVFLAGLVIFTAASVACGISTDMVMLGVSRGVQGVGAAVLYAVGPALIGREFLGRSRGSAFGIFGAGSGLAIALGPLIGGALTSGAGWRWIFLVNVPVGVVAFALGVLRMPAIAGHGTIRRVDWAGLVSFSAGLALLVFGLLRGEQDGWSSPMIFGSLLASAVLLTAFVLIERARGGAAMLDLGFFRIGTFRAISVAAILVAASGMAAIFLLVSYVQNALGYSPWASGVRFLPMTGALFVAAIVAGKLTARVPHRVLVAVAAACIGVGLLLVKPLVSASSDWTALLPTMLLLGTGLGLFNPPRAALSIGVVEPAKSGAASGTNITFQQVGLALGIAGLGALFQTRVADQFADPGAGKAVAAGAVGPAGEGGRVAFVASLGEVLVVGAVLALAAAVVAVLWIRARDLHTTAVATGHHQVRGVESVGS